MKVLSLATVPLAAAVIVAAHVAGGGSARTLLDAAAALIVLGGTLAATLVSHSLSDLGRATRSAIHSFVHVATPVSELSASLVAWSIRAHRQGVFVLDSELDQIDDPYLRHAMTLAVDGIDVALLRDVLAAEGRAQEAHDDAPVRVFETAAGYAPTFGMLGAVLGLMHVMSAFDQPERLGAGIATAFVATVYGLALANGLLLPLAGRLRERLLTGVRRRELILEAVVGLRQRNHPRLIAATIRAVAPEATFSDDVGLHGMPTAPAYGGRPS
jgi:chemotaxis protein MotA